MILILLIILAIFFPLLWIIVVPLILVHVGVFLLNRWADKANETEHKMYLIHWFYHEFLPEAYRLIELEHRHSITERNSYPESWIYNMAQLYERDFCCPELIGSISAPSIYSEYTHYDVCACVCIYDNAWFKVLLESKESDEDFYTGISVAQVDRIGGHRAERSIKIGKINKSKLVKLRK